MYVPFSVLIISCPLCIVSQLMFEMKFEFLQAVCEYEHFVPLNFPWPQIRDGACSKCGCTV